MERQCDREAAPGKSAAASTARGFCPAAASHDWSRRVHRRACMQLTRQQRIEISLSSPTASPPIAEVILSRAQLAHSRLSWTQRLARNARPATAGQVTIRHDARSSRLCSLTRVGDGLMLSCHPMASFFSDQQAAPSGASCSLFPLCCRFCSLSRRVGCIFRLPRPVLPHFRLPITGALFYNLVAYPVGSTGVVFCALLSAHISTLPIFLL